MALGSEWCFYVVVHHHEWFRHGFKMVLEIDLLIS